jgi:Icc-related predicted phosphoesterase
MKILHITDLHGNEEKYNKCLQIAIKENVDIIVNSGDMLPNIKRQQIFIESFLYNYFKKIEENKIHYVCYLGNDDIQALDGYFNLICSKFKFVHNIPNNIVLINEYEFLGFNLVCDYPFQLKDRCRMDNKDFVFERQFGPGLYSIGSTFNIIKDWTSHVKTLPTLEEELKKLPSPQDFKKTIFICHNPPYGLGLDQCMNGRCVGSKSVYKFIQYNQPFLSLHGHIHESPSRTGKWENMIGDTLCIQPGQSHSNKLTYVIINITDINIERQIFTK